MPRPSFPDPPVLRLPAAAILLLGVGLALWGPTPTAAAAEPPVAFVGTNFLLSQGTTGAGRPRIAAAGDGFVMVWSGVTEDQGEGTYYRLFSPDGEPAGELHRAVHRGAAGPPEVVALPGGGFAIAQSEQTGANQVLRLTIYRADGTPRAGPVVVGEPQQGEFAIRFRLATEAASGRMVVLWARPVDDGFLSPQDLLAQRLLADGSPVGEPVLVARANGPIPSIAAAFGDERWFLVSWVPSRQDVLPGVLVRRFAADGTPLEEPWRIEVSVPEDRTPVHVVASQADAHGVSLAYDWVINGRPAVKLYRVDRIGNSSAFSVVDRSFTDGYLGPPLAVATSPDGAKLVAWTDTRPDAFGIEIFARVVDGAFRLLGPRSQVNREVPGTQESPDVAVIGPSRFLIVWSVAPNVFPEEIRGQIVRVDQFAHGTFPAPSQKLFNQQGSWDRDRVRAFLARLAVDAPGAPLPPTVLVGLTRSGDFSGVARVRHGVADTTGGLAESQLAFATNPEETPLLRNPERLQLPSVSLARIPPASDLVPPGSTGVLRVTLDPTLTSGPSAPDARLSIDNVVGGRSADAKPGRGLASILRPYHDRFVPSDARVVQVLQRLIRVETDEATSSVEVAIFRDFQPDRFIIEAFLKGPEGESLGRLSAALSVTWSPDGRLWTGRLEASSHCVAASPWSCTTVTGRTVLKLVPPTANRAGESPGVVSVEAFDGPGRHQVYFFSWEDLLGQTTWEAAP